MLFSENVSLKNFNTFGVEAFARYFIQVTDEETLTEAVFFARHCGWPILILGGGSNVLFTKNFPGLVIHIAIKGIQHRDLSNEFVLLSCGAGEIWHQVVLHALENRWGGIENLSLIPGTVGAAPMQNIGAYGVELQEVFHSLEALMLDSLSIRNFNAADCRFGYRESIFKNELKGKCVITRVNLTLTKDGYHRLNTEYGAIEQWLTNQSITQPDIQAVSSAVIAIRQSKLPDPKILGNAGSFFKNPTVPSAQYQLLKNAYPAIPGYLTDDGHVKIPAGWLIEQAGFKGKSFGNCGVHKDQALVLVNYGHATGIEILEMANTISQVVEQKFGISLQKEVNIID